MFNLKHMISILFVVVISAWAIIYSMFGNFDFEKNNKLRQLVAASNDNSQMENLYYYKMKNSERALDLHATKMDMIVDESKTILKHPIGSAYNGKKEPVNFQSDGGVLAQDDDRIDLNGNVFLNTETFKTTAEQVSFWNQTDLLKANGSVETEAISTTDTDQIVINANQLTAYPRANRGIYTGGVKGVIKRKLKYEENISFMANRVELDANSSYMKLTSNVEIYKENLDAKAMRGEIFLENYNKSLKYYVLYEDVKLTEKVLKDGRIIERLAFGEKLVGNQRDGIIVLTGYPKVLQEEDIIKGNKITLRENNQIIEVDEANTMFMLKE